MKRQLKSNCKVTDKISYRDEEAALWAAEKITRERIAAARQVTKNTRWTPAMLYAYSCAFCGHWHLTSQERDPGRLARLGYSVEDYLSQTYRPRVARY